MLWILQAVTERLRALFATDVALGLEAEIASRQAARKADLLRQAQRYETEGLVGVAAELREQAGQLSLERPLASAAPAMDEWRQPLPASQALGRSSRQASLPAPPVASRQALVPTTAKRRKPR